MTGDEMERAIEFILQQQAKLEAGQQIFQDGMVELKENLNKVGINLDRLGMRVDTVTENVNNLVSAVNLHGVYINVLEASVNTLAGAIGTLAAHADADRQVMRNAIDQFTIQANKDRAEIRALVGRVTDLEGRVDNLEG